MLAIRTRRNGLGQVFDEMGDPTDIAAVNMYGSGMSNIITPPTDRGVSIINPNYAGSPNLNTGPSWLNTLQASIPGLLNIGAGAVKNLTTPMATIAGPYGMSTIPAGASPSIAGNLNLGAMGGSSMLLIGGAVLIMMMMGRK